MCLKISSRILTGITIIVPCHFMDLLFPRFRTSGRHLHVICASTSPVVHHSLKFTAVYGR